ncbi:MAG: bifunctional hydroxymethylpyrimidine kinase/phosphomethylpyrimidine kinase, partial [Myxococcota bacterium]
KIGMLASADLVQTVAEGLEAHRARNVVLDPVMVAKSGDRLLAADAVSALREHLVPRAEVITPNLPEVADLLERPEPKSRSEMRAAGEHLLALGPRHVLVKGGHLSDDPTSPDLLLGAGPPQWLEAPRTATRNTHGTGCSLSSAIAAHLARGLPVIEAVHAAKAWVAAAIARADDLDVGHGSGPIHHFHALWERLDKEES